MVDEPDLEAPPRGDPTARLLLDMLDRDAIVYGGFSAGAVVAGPSLAGYELMDDPEEVPAGYERAVVWDGLGLVDFAIVPHFRSRHPQTEAAERLSARLASRKRPFRALRDGEAVVWTGPRSASNADLRRSA